MSEYDKSYFARRAAEEAELALSAADPDAAEAHRQLQRAYIERASVGDRAPKPAEHHRLVEQFPARLLDAQAARAARAPARSRG